METPASVWPEDPSDPMERRGPPCVWDSSPPAGWTWEQQFSPHLQRNKQLQDALLQREEELARLQEENSKLREFLSSSFVRNLQEKAEKLGVASHAALKRTQMTRDGETPPFSTHRLLNAKKVSKRVCRNLTAEFCSETPESPSELNLDQWVLRTLGLKDRDTIDTSSPFVLDFSDWEEDSSSGSTFDSPISTATPSSVHSCCRGGASEPDHGFSAADPDTLENCTGSAGIGPLLNLTVHEGSHETRIRNFNFWTSFHTDGLDLHSMTASSSVRSPDRNAAEPPFWSRPPHRWTPPEQPLPPPFLTSTPTSNQPRLSAGSWNPTSPSVPPEVQTPRRCTDVAFSMLLCPSSSVKTHSFPQGQAFVRRDTGGRCNFTWVPR
ncbi:Geminin coiled-coil domain-containing protein 1 [Oryzias melastigma]|uniref:Geminin coiled-coil domain-containing protein 1 n=1 Tax=Oryzias melastigma TaxID=30732 RepID=A0A834FCW5_ORYME|nr:Geminin coiled-coil domain-containing protein 1 [Oryzias melastigma]